MTYGITSSSQIIDIEGIQAGVNKIKTTAEDFTTCGNTVNKAADTCDAKALEIEGKTMQPTIEELATNIKDLKASVDELADSILSAANTVYNTQCEELREYERKLKEAEEKNNG